MNEENDRETGQPFASRRASAEAGSGEGLGAPRSEGFVAYPVSKDELAPAKLSTGVAVDVRTRYASLLQDIWSIAAEASGGRPLGSVPLGDNPYLRRVAERFEPSYFYSAQWQRGERSTVRGLVGSLQEVSVQVMIEVQRLGADVRGVREFLRTTVAGTLQRLETEGVGTPENHVDMILMPLQELLPRRCSDSLREFMAGLRGYLELQAGSDRGDGYFITRGGLADSMVNATGRECAVQCIYYYHEILSHYCREGERRGLTVEELHRVRVAGNNSANLIDDLLRLRQRRDEEAVGVQRLLKEISVAVSVSRLDIAAEEFEQATQSVRGVVGGGESRLDATACALLDEMMSSPAAWLPGRSYLQLAFLEAMAGVVRVSVAARRKDAASTFFNAGVSLGRWLTGKAAGERETRTAVRVVMNGLGLWWALTDGEKDLVSALRENDGLSCLVNLLGAASSGELDEEGRQQVRVLAGLVMPLERRFGGLEADLFRIRNSLRDARVAEEEAQGLEVSVAAAQGAALAMVRRALAVLKLERSGWERLGVEETALAVRAVFAALGESSGAVSGDLVADLVDTVGEIRERGRNPAATLADLYGPWAADEAEGSPGVGPLVPARLLGEADWKRVAREAVDREVRSLAALLRAERSLDWLVAGR